MESPKQYVMDFVGPELWEEIDRRITDGQRPAQAVINAGDHYDRIWSWSDGWSAVVLTEGWDEIAQFLQNWGAQRISMFDDYQTTSEADSILDDLRADINDFLNS